LQADYVTVVEDRPIMSTKYRILLPFFHFWPKITHAAARSVFDSWAFCSWSTCHFYRFKFRVSPSHIALTLSPLMSGPNSPTSIHWIMRLIRGNAGVLIEAAIEVRNSSRVYKMHFS